MTVALEHAGPRSATDAVELVRRNVCAQLSGRRQPLSYLGLEAQKKQLHELLTRTIDIGEGNSAILVGPPGMGKTMLLNDVLASLRSRTGDAGSKEPRPFQEIHLSGLRHTNTRLALRAIALALLNHSTTSTDTPTGATAQLTQFVEGDVHAQDEHLGSVADVMDALLTTLHGGGRQNTSLVFVLDYIDRFTSHHNQTLLYNLFDIVQRAAVPIAVVGITTRDDIYDMFEKRVRSRFSHRFIHVYNTLTFEQYSQTAHNLLTVPEDVATSSVAMKSVCKEWDAHTTALCASPKALTALRNQYELDASIRSLQLFLLPLVSRLSVNYNGTVNTRSVSAEAFFARVTELRKDEKIVILKGLTSLELALLIALVCLGSKHGIETFNFEMAYNEYKEFCIGKTTKATGTIPLFSKPVAMKAWERLVQLEMVVTAPGNTKTVTKRHKTHYITISPALLNIALQQHIDCPTALVRWATAGIASSYAYEV